MRNPIDVVWMVGEFCCWLFVVTGTISMVIGILLFLFTMPIPILLFFRASQIGFQFLCTAGLIYAVLILSRVYMSWLVNIPKRFEIIKTNSAPIPA